MGVTRNFLDQRGSGPDFILVQVLELTYHYSFFRQLVETRHICTSERFFSSLRQILGKSALIAGVPQYWVGTWIQCLPCLTRPVTICGAAQASSVTRAQVIQVGQTLTALTHYSILLPVRWPLNLMVGWLLFGITYDNHLQQLFFSSIWWECFRLVQKLFALFWKLFELFHYFGCFCVEFNFFHCWSMIWLISLLGILIFSWLWWWNNTTQLFNFFWYFAHGLSLPGIFSKSPIKQWENHFNVFLQYLE